MALVFGHCVLDLDRRELSRPPSGIVATPPKVFDLLVYLVENRERVVSRDDLLHAVWDGRIVSESTLASHINAVRKAVGDNGHDQALIRTVARKGFRFVGAVTECRAAATHGSPDAEAGPAEPPAASPAPVDKPSIAVLPFVNLSRDPEQDYFADGMVEDIIGALSRLRWLFVIARNSSFAYKGRTIDVKQVGRELGVRYVLEGSVRRADRRIRITGQLIDAATGGHLWADRFEGALDDIFELQDRMTESVVGAIAPQLERAEIRRAQRKPTGSLDSYDYYLYGMASFHRGTSDAIDAALPSFRKAIELDREFASAYGMAAWCHLWRRINNWPGGSASDIAEGHDLACRAVALGKDDAVALTRGGHALAHFGGDLDRGVALLDRALALNPNLSSAWFLGAYLRLWRGEPDAAIERFAHAMRLSPLDSELFRMQAGMAMAHLLAGRFDMASTWAERSSRDVPGFLMVAGIIAASHALADRTDDARRAMDRLRALNPALRLSLLGSWLPIRQPQHAALFAEGLRRAGLPE
ncbi:MAG TPA: winged helix-turn-helix domain-containing protein [Tahibacter sp.]|uniref:winged helix-turn-helix domain-containing tetratricopeptide repeat protein n=1 Tax=Tahibacter sp. TaxID=2056211 RepID=UPI002B5BFD38|nr:winged helix-turn-helix domain-containing protein [Tahibacter sp.]HSX61076.1 winged helix-turn-helix domain-containing protein [Tahibacter sp.]